MIILVIQKTIVQFTEGKKKWKWLKNSDKLYASKQLMPKDMSDIKQREYLVNV